jgi:hypothetical protein
MFSPARTAEEAKRISVSSLFSEWLFALELAAPPDAETLLVEDWPTEKQTASAVEAAGLVQTYGAEAAIVAEHHGIDSGILHDFLSSLDRRSLDAMYRFAQRLDAKEWAEYLASAKSRRAGQLLELADGFARLRLAGGDDDSANVELSALFAQAARAYCELGKQGIAGFHDLTPSVLKWDVNGAPFDERDSTCRVLLEHAWMDLWLNIMTITAQQEATALPSADRIAGMEYIQDHFDSESGQSLGRHMYDAKRWRQAAEDAAQVCRVLAKRTEVPGAFSPTESRSFPTDIRLDPRTRRIGALAAAERTPASPASDDSPSLPAHVTKQISTAQPLKEQDDERLPPGLRPKHKAVLRAMQGFQWEELVSLETIAETAGYSERTVGDVVKWLIDRGYAERETRGSGARLTTPGRRLAAKFAD